MVFCGRGLSIEGLLYVVLSNCVFLSLFAIYNSMHYRNSLTNCMTCSSPSVLAVCPDYSRDHGNFTVSGQQFHRNTQGTRVDISCDDGFQPLFSSNSAVCEASGQWSPHTPGCSGNDVGVHVY